MTRGIRNNNPLNIRHSADRWVGARIAQTDPGFVQFETMAYGYRAAWKVLESYWKHFKRRRQPFTVARIIARWAPPDENHTEAYVRTVLNLTSLGGHENLPRPFTGIAIDKLVRLLAAMTTMECGIPYKEVDTEAIWEGYELAFPGKLGAQIPNGKHVGSPIVESPFRIELPAEMEDCRHLDEYWDWSPEALPPLSS